MWLLVGILTIFQAKAEFSNIDERRIGDFQKYLLKKEASENKRLAAADNEKLKRRMLEKSYEMERSQFKRPPPRGPVGLDKYLEKLAQMEKRYETDRMTYSQRKRQLMETIFKKIDSAKMVEYDIKKKNE